MWGGPNELQFELEDIFPTNSQGETNSDADVPGTASAEQDLVSGAINATRPVFIQTKEKPALTQTIEPQKGSKLNPDRPNHFNLKRKTVYDNQP